ncbi:MAG: transcription elongation factor GreA [Leptospiraceae bacterium]|nr:transcription elongation factor GreA [Leptospiraceae bacterium]
MSEEITVINEKKSSELDKLISIFNEEIYIRIDAATVPVTKFKILDDLIDNYTSINKIEEAKEKISEHLFEHSESISARYLTGIIGLIQNKIEDMKHLRSLLEQFKSTSRWTVIEYICDKILVYGEQRMALAFKAEALEKLNKNKELKSVLEKLVRHDRKNPEIAKKYAFSILAEDRNKAINYLKQAAESFARAKDYHQLEEIWPLLIEHNFEDIPFFEKIERLMVYNKEKTRLVLLLYPLVEQYKQLEDWDKIIHLLKKILENEPSAPKARNDLIRAYKAKYVNHSLLDDFLKMSEIGNNRKPVKNCIANFERNIVFDTNNYVLHRNWGVGKIVSISSVNDSIIVDFQDKKNHKLSIQMAISSLKPLKKDHIWVKYYENPNEIIELFNNNVSGFLVEFLTSYNNLSTISEIKGEIIGRFLKRNEDWTKWWSKAKLVLKKDPRIGFNPKKKDELIYRQKPISLAEELTEKFNAVTDINKKIDIALEALEEPEAAEDAIDSFHQYYFEEEESKDSFRRIVAYLFLDIYSSLNPNADQIIPRKQTPSDIEDLLRSLPIEELLQVSKQLNNVEMKKSFANLLKKHHNEYTRIYVELLFEIPVKINKYVFTQLVAEGKHDELNMFLETGMNRSKDFPEVFLWIAKSILTGAWSFDWLKVSENALVLKVFRILKPLAKIEEKGTKLKNSANDILFGNENKVIKNIINNSDEDYIRKIYALYKEVPYISDIEKEKFYNLINELKPNLKWDDYVSSEDEEDDSVLIPDHIILVTRASLMQKKDELNHIVYVEMVENSRDIGEAQEKGDLRENAEYKAAMEKQSQLQAQAKKLEEEIKSAKILDFSAVKTDKINVGCTVKLINTSNNEEITYSVLGLWDADTEKNVISYQSPLGKSLLGKKINETASVNFEGNKTDFKIVEISRYNLN